MKKYILFSIIALVIFFAATPVWAACTGSSPTWYTSPDYTSVNTCVGNASDGDTINISAGTAPWTSGVTINKSLTLNGAGIGTTIIQDNTSGGANQVFYLQGAGKTIKLMNMSITDTGHDSGDSVGSINIGGADSWVVLHYIAFSGQYWRALVWHGTRVYGVISHCSFDDVNGIGALPDNWDEEWTTPMSYGTANAVFVEDSTFTYSSWGGGTPVLDGKHGARVVFRYNTVTNGWIGTHGCDSVVRSAMQHEYYGNTFNGDGWTTIQFRGGSGLVYDNTINGYHSGGALQLTYYRSHSGCGGLCTPCMFANQPWCDGNQSIDGNTPGGYGYPCRDQIGRGANQALYPMYQWNNSGYNWIVIDQEGGTDYSGYHTQANRDYYNCTSLSDAKSKGLSANYSPYQYPHPLVGGTTPPPTYQCSDNIDNDSDGLIDYPSDPGCSSATDNDEYNAPVQIFLPEQYIEAEVGQLSSMLTGTSGSDTYIYTTTDNTGSASFVFNIQNSGQYRIEARVNNNNNGGLNSFFVGLDSEAAQGNDYYSYGIFPLALGFNWDNVSRWGNGQAGDPPISEFDPMVWDLSAGLHTFTFYGRESNTWLDQIILKRVTADTTPPAAPTGVVVN